MSYRNSLLFAMAVLMAVALAACGAAPAEQPAAPAPTHTPLPPTDTPVPPTDTPVPPTATPVPPTNTPAAPAPTSAAGTTQPAVDEPTPLGPVTLSVFTLPGISSYRMRMEFTAAGAAFEEQQQVPGAIQMTGEFVKEPPAQRLVIRSGEEVFAEMVKIGERSWTSFAGMWMETTGEEAPDFTEEFLFFDVNELGRLDEFEKVGKEEVNGIMTIHYRFNKETLRRALGAAAEIEEWEMLTTAEGDMYVSPDGFIVKWNMRFEGAGLNTDKPEASGSVTTTYQIYDLNAPIEIKPPEQAGAGLGIDLPVPEGAKPTLVMERMVTYEIAEATVEDLVEFYKTKLPALGFTLNEDDTLVSEDFANLTFTGEGIKLSISIFAGDEGFQIMITTETEE